MPKDEKKTEVTVVARREKFRRAGREFSPAPTTLEVTEKELEALRAEPMLIVTTGKPAEKAVEKKPLPAITTRAFNLTLEEAGPVIAKAPSIEALEALTAGDDREGIKKAVEARRKELQK